MRYTRYFADREAQGGNADEPGAGGGHTDRPARESERNAAKKEAGFPGTEQEAAGKKKKEEYVSPVRGRNPAGHHDDNPDII